MKHTKGPLAVSLSTLVVDKEGRVLAQCGVSFIGSDDLEEVTANATIFSASPDMYDALIGIRDCSKDLLNAMMDMGLHVQVRLFQEKMTGLPAVVRAIDKAEGR